MELLDTNSLIVVGGIVGFGVALAPIARVVWTMRILIASYVALCFVFLMPESFAFDPRANIAYFVLIAVLFAAVERGHLFDVSSWMVGRFDVRVFVFSALTWLFVFAAVSLLMPFSYLAFVIPEPVYEIATHYIFYFGIIPLLFAVIFSRHS
jgi:hypothetical protein